MFREILITTIAAITVFMGASYVHSGEVLEIDNSPITIINIAQ